MNIGSSWSATVWLSNTDRLEDLVFPKLDLWASPHYLVIAGTQVVILDESQKNSSPILPPHTQTLFSGRWVNWCTWGSHFEYFASWVVSTDWIVVYFWKVDPRIKLIKWFCSPTPIPTRSILLCTIKDLCHSTAAPFCWHSESSFSFTSVRALHTFCVPSGSWSLHSTRQEKHTPEQKEARTLGVPKIRAISLAHFNELLFTFSRL